MLFRRSIRGLYIFLLLIAIIQFSGINAISEQTLHYYKESLPIGLTPEESTRLDEIGRGFTRSAPPPTPIRNCAEWEPSEGVIIRYPLGIPYDIVREMAEDLMVTVIVASSYYQSQAESNFAANGVNLDHIQYLIASTNSWWTRDYGPWFIFDGRDSLAIVDHIYNRPRPLDDLIPSELGADWGLEVYGMDLITTGGNHMSDGLGRSMSTQLVYDENPSLTNDEVDSIMMAYLGNDYTVLGYIESGGIHHIDCWAKFLNPTTILVKDVPVGSSSYSLLNARAEYLSQITSAWGRPYDIVRIYCPYGTAYTNSIILNNKVLVPTFGVSQDDVAIQTYKDAMPGYEVIGFDGTWYDDDAIHCRAMGVPDRGMLYIKHVPLFVTGDTENDYEVGATIKDYSEAGLEPDSLLLYYRTKGPAFASVTFSPTAYPDSFVAYIPAQNAGTTVEYYIKAADSSGRVETHPYIGSPWAHKFKINSAPEITSPDTIHCQASEEVTFYPEYTDIDDSVFSITYTNLPDWLTISNDSLVGTAPDTTSLFDFTVSVSDPYTMTEKTIALNVSMPFICGDANSDSLVNILDITYLIAYLYNEGPSPSPPESADVDGNGIINILDITYLIAYLYYSGTSLIC